MFSYVDDLCVLEAALLPQMVQAPDGHLVELPRRFLLHHMCGAPPLLGFDACLQAYVSCVYMFQKNVTIISCGCYKR